MITTDYFGRTGNNMFQYAMARLIAMHSGLKLGTDWNRNDFLEATECQVGKEITGKPLNIVDNQIFAVAAAYNHPIHLHGYFQRKHHVSIYNEHRDLIRKFWKIPDSSINTQDLVIHLRLTDYWWYRNACVINPKWYFDIINKESWRNLYIVVEPHVTNEKYLGYFKEFNPRIVSMSPREDFLFFMTFDRIVCSNSTFAWWAAFLSEARKVWTFEQWMNKDSELEGMAGAKVVPGYFIRDRYLSGIDWTDYWKKPDSYFKV